jgi:hypothetical protein
MKRESLYKNYLLIAGQEKHCLDIEIYPQRPRFPVKFARLPKGRLLVFSKVG